MATTSIDREKVAPEKEYAISSQPYGVYLCPTCKRELELAPGSLDCRARAVSYPIRDGIPDFVVENLEENSNRSLRMLSAPYWNHCSLKNDRLQDAIRSKMPRFT